MYNFANLDDIEFKYLCKDVMSRNYFIFLRNA